MLYKLYAKSFSLTEFYVKLSLFVIINGFFFTRFVPNYVFDIAIVINILLSKLLLSKIIVCSARLP